jgi:cbb3-type cytochrome oxidase subunit 3
MQPTTLAIFFIKRTTWQAYNRARKEAAQKEAEIYKDNVNSYAKQKFYPGDYI